MKHGIITLILSVLLPVYGFSETFRLTPDSFPIDEWLKKAKPGDTLLLAPGTYPAEQIIENIHGSPDKPICIISSSDNPDQFAVIDGKSAPGNDLNHFAFHISSSSWLVFENLKIINCWTDVIPIMNSSYLSFIDCNFTGGRRVIYPQGEGCHHILVDGCNWDQSPEVWETDFTRWESHRDWWADMHHGEKRYYNGALFHPYETEGMYVMRNCTIRNAFNGFRTRPKALNEDGNGEVYNNTFINIRDNEFEPEVFAWNIHFYHNTMINIHNIVSVHGVKGGYIYIYGNTWTQDSLDYTEKIVINVWKYSDSPLKFPMYVFNNSFYTRTKLFGAVKGEENKNLKHFNNAYFLDGPAAYNALYYWDESFEFDYNCINQPWPELIVEKSPGKNGLIANPGFRDPYHNDFQLTENSPCIDAGTTLTLPEFGWSQEYTGSNPDIGAYEGERRITGPPFLYIPPPGGNSFNEKPRIVRHEVQGKKLILYFSLPLDPESVNKSNLKVICQNKSLAIDNIYLNGRELRLKTDQTININDLKLNIKEMPTGVNGEKVTGWASTIPVLVDQQISRD